MWNFDTSLPVVHTPTIRTVLGSFGRIPRVLWRLRDFVRAHEVDTVLLLYPNEVAWPFLVLRHLNQIRLVTSLHGNDVMNFEDHTSLGQRLLRRVLAESDLLVACSDHLIQKAGQILCGEPPESIVIPNCVDVEYFSPIDEASPTDDLSIVHISNFAPKKRVTDIVRAFATADLPAGSTLTLVGDGPDRNTARTLAEDLGVEDRVRFPGRVSDVRPFLQRADVFVLASEKEGAPLVLLEAMACGVPWISTAWGAARDLRDGECGLTVPPHSPDRLARALASLARDEDERRRMGRRAREIACSKYSCDRYIDRHVELLRNL